MAETPNIPGENAPDANVLFKLYQTDIGSKDNRTSHSEYNQRTPACRILFTQNELRFEIHNMSRIRSQFLIIEHQFIFCTLAGHGPADGFTTIHAGEESHLGVDALMSAAEVAAGRPIQVSLKVPEFPFVGLRRIYFRAHVRPFMARPLPKAEWDFASNPCVTEMYLKI